MDCTYRSTSMLFPVGVLNKPTGETISHSLLAQYHLAPPLLARFENGLIYKFIQGCVCTPEDLCREQIRRGVARKLGEWHRVLPVASVSESNGTDHSDDAPPLFAPLPRASPYSQRIKSVAPGKTVPNLWTVMQKWILALPEETESEKKRNDLLQKELERLVIEFGNLPGLGEDGVCSGFARLSH